MHEPGQLIDPYDAKLEPLNLRELADFNIGADVLRLDQVHPVISGNKWFKLKYYLKDAKAKGYNHILTFGGAWSNHIVATAYSAQLSGFTATGIIRGERPDKLSQTLLDSASYGMSLKFIDRIAYSKKADKNFIAQLQQEFGEAYIIPEGGAGITGVKGSSEILNQVKVENYSHIICCIGTGTMINGILNTSLPDQQVIGIPVLKGLNFNQHLLMITNMPKNNLIVIDDYHFGGYAKKTTALINFMNNFYLQTNVPTDFVYTGKLFFGFSDLMSKGYFPPGSKVLVIHSGGLQGNASLSKGTLLF